MPRLPGKLAGRLRHHVATWFSARLEESRHCRDCDAAVSPWDQVCPECGTTSPARVHISPLVFAGLGLAVLAVLAVVQAV